jgi:hypothetical protein
VTERDRQFADAACVVDESLVMRVVARSVDAIVRRARLSGSSEFKLPILKGSAYGLLVGTGCLTHWLLLQFLPARVTPVRPLAYGMVVAFAFLATVAGLITTRSDATATAERNAGTAKTRNN